MLTDFKLKLPSDLEKESSNVINIPFITEAVPIRKI